jgi:hypothetical protein
MHMRRDGDADPTGDRRGVDLVLTPREPEQSLAFVRGWLRASVDINTRELTIAREDGDLHAMARLYGRLGEVRELQNALDMVFGKEERCGDEKMHGNGMSQSDAIGEVSGLQGKGPEAGE